MTSLLKDGYKQYSGLVRLLLHGEDCRHHSRGVPPQTTPSTPPRLTLLQEEAILRNIEACKGLAAIVRTSMGPNGMNKLVVNHLEKLFVTSDAATIVQELEVAHPAARMIVLAAKMQEQEVRSRGTRPHRADTTGERQTASPKATGRRVGRGMPDASSSGAPSLSSPARLSSYPRSPPVRLLPSPSPRSATPLILW